MSIILLTRLPTFFPLPLMHYVIANVSPEILLMASMLYIYTSTLIFFSLQLDRRTAKTTCLIFMSFSGHFLFLILALLFPTTNDSVCLFL